MDASTTAKDSIAFPPFDAARTSTDDDRNSSETGPSELRILIDADGVDSILKGLSWLDRFLAPLVLLAMILGVVIGKFAPNVDSVLNGAKFEGVSARKFGPSSDRSPVLQQLWSSACL